MHARQPEYLNTDLSFEKRVSDLASRMTPEEKAAVIFLAGYPGVGD